MWRWSYSSMIIYSLNSFEMRNYTNEVERLFLVHSVYETFLVLLSTASIHRIRMRWLVIGRRNKIDWRFRLLGPLRLNQKRISFKQTISCFRLTICGGRSKSDHLLHPISFYSPVDSNVSILKTWMIRDSEWKIQNT